MAGLPKKYWKLYPGNLKKAWAAFRAEKGVSRPVKKTVRHKKNHKKAQKSVITAKAAPMAKKRKSHKARRTVKRAVGFAKRAGRRVASAGATKPGKVALMAVVAAGGGVVTSFAINNIPKVKEMSPTTKSLVQGGLGVAAIMFGGKRQIVKSLGAGAIIAGIFGLSKSLLKLDPLAGPSAGANTLSPESLQRLLNGGRLSSPVNRVTMNRPASGVTMNRPASVTMGESFPIPGWNSGRWGNGWG